jgi:hypothetical protein
MSHSTPNWTEPEREQVFAEALRHPETPEELAVQQAKFRAWRSDERYQHLWRMLDRLIQSPLVSDADGALARREQVAR